MFMSAVTAHSQGSYRHSQGSYRRYAHAKCSLCPINCIYQAIEAPIKYVSTASNNHSSEYASNRKCLEFKKICFQKKNVILNFSKFFFGIFRQKSSMKKKIALILMIQGKKKSNFFFLECPETHGNLSIKIGTIFFSSNIYPFFSVRRAPSPTLLVFVEGFFHDSKVAIFAV